MRLHALSVHTHLQHYLCQRSHKRMSWSCVVYSYNASRCSVHASSLSHIECTIRQLEQLLSLTLLCVQADRKWSDMPVRGSMDSDASSGYSTPSEAVHHSSLFSTSTNSRPGGLIRSDRQPGGGAHTDSKRVKRKSEIARDSNDPASSEHKSAEIAQDGNSPFKGQRKSAETARPGQEISSIYRSRSVGDAIAAFVVARSRSSTLRALREMALGVVKEDKA